MSRRSIAARMRVNRARTFAVFGILLLRAMAAHAEGGGEGDLIAGPTRAVDAGTFDLATYRVRIWGVDAPERGSWCFRNGEKWRPAAAATQALGACLMGRITCRIHKRERHWFAVRYVSECWSEDGRDIGDCMVEAGWATDYTCYSDGYYKDRETEAKNKRLGLWGVRQRTADSALGQEGRGRAVRDAGLQALRSRAALTGAPWDGAARADTAPAALDQGSSLMMRLPKSSTTPVCPQSTSVVASASVRIAGPSMRAPAPSRERA